MANRQRSNSQVTAYREPGKQKKVEEEKSPVIYIGPSLPNGELNQNTLFSCSKERVERQLCSAIEKYPLIPQLIVAVSDLPQIEQKLKSGGNYLSKAFLEIKSRIQNQKEE